MTTIEQVRTRLRETMNAAGIPEYACDVFLHNVTRYESGEQAYVPEAAIDPISDLTHIDSLAAADHASLEGVAMIRLNGGIGTTMALTIPKSLICVREGMTFMDIILAQVAALKEEGVDLPLYLLNSPATAPQMKAWAVARGREVIPEIVQNLVPRLDPHTLLPAQVAHPWAPPGHGDLLNQLKHTQLLHTLAEAGYHTLFIANADNLGALPDPRIATWMKESGAEFACEVVARNAMDTKGGHFAVRRADGHIILREIAQTPTDDLHYFQDISRHRYLNTNNVWISIPALLAHLEEHTYFDLPLISNMKQIEGKPCLQLESALGCAIELFSRSALLQVGRDRFIPVKTTRELLLLRSDLYVRNSSSHLIAQRDSLPYIELDPRYYAAYEDFEERFAVVPSLIGAESLRVEGDVYFDAPRTITGECVITAEAASL